MNNEIESYVRLKYGDIRKYSTIKRIPAEVLNMVLDKLYPGREDPEPTTEEMTRIRLCLRIQTTRDKEAVKSALHESIREYEQRN